MTQYEACIAIAELLKSFPIIERMNPRANAKEWYSELLTNLFTLAGIAAQPAASEAA